VSNYLAKLQNSYDVVRLDIDGLNSVVTQGKIPDWLQDDLYNLTKNRLSDKLRKGLFLTSFNSVELFIMDVSWIVIDLINSLEFSLSNLKNDKDISKIKNCILNSAKNNISHHSDYLRMLRAYEASISIQKLVRESTIEFNENCFFTKSNVSYEDMIEASKVFIPIFNSWIEHCGDFSGRVYFVPFSNFLDSWMHVRIPFSRRVRDEYADIIKLRNSCAHKARFHLSILELRQSCGYFSYLTEAIYVYHHAIFLVLEKLRNNEPINFFDFISYIDGKRIQYQITHSGIVRYI
jgi:hypothetical protein